MGVFCEIHFYSFLNKRILNQQPVEADGKKAFDNYECKKQKAAKIYFELIDYSGRLAHALKRVQRTGIAV